MTVGVLNFVVMGFRQGDGDMFTAAFIDGWIVTRDEGDRYEADFSFFIPVIVGFRGDDNSADQDNLYVFVG